MVRTLLHPMRTYIFTNWNVSYLLTSIHTRVWTMQILGHKLPLLVSCVAEAEIPWPWAYLLITYCKQWSAICKIQRNEQFCSVVINYEIFYKLLYTYVNARALWQSMSCWIERTGTLDQMFCIIYSSNIFLYIYIIRVYPGKSRHQVILDRFKVSFPLSVVYLSVYWLLL